MRRRMRKGLAAGFFAALALGGLAVAVLSLRDNAASEREHRASIALDGAASMLAERYGLELESLVAGRSLAADRYDFRGALAGEHSRSMPVYGIVELTCEALNRDPGCWQLVVLERDGASWDPRQTEAAEEAAADVATNAAEASAGDETSTSPAPAPPATAENAQPERVATAPSSMPDPDPGALAADGEVAELAAVDPPREEAAEIFLVAEPVVNGRAGPGTEHAIVAKVTPEMRLELRAQQGDWGRFRVAGEVGSETDPLWIWMPLVQPQSGDPEE